MKIRHMIMSPDGDGGAGGGGNGGAGGTGTDKDAGGDKNQPKTVPLEQFTKLETEAKAHQGRVKELESKLNTLAEQIAANKTKDATDKGDFKALYDTVKSEKEDLEKQHKEFKNSVFNNERMRALEAELKKRGLKAGAETVADFADLEKMPFEVTSRGRILIHGADEMAADLEKRYAYAFSKEKVPEFNSGGGSGGEGSEDNLTPQFMVELESKDPKKYRELMPRYLKERQKRIQNGG